MNRIERPARAREAVAAMDVVAGLTDAELDALLDELEWVEVPGGEALFHEGEVSDSFYVIVRGRLRALLTDDAGEMVVIRELSRGDPVGELGLLTGAPRSATVVAVRDTELAALLTGRVRARGRAHPTHRACLLPVSSRTG